MSKTLLVVDDSPTIREAARLALAGEAWAVATAESADEALDSVLRSPVDAVLVDAGLGGAAFCRRLRAMPGGRDLPVLLMGPTVTSAEARAAGATGALVKPFGSSELTEALQAALDAQGFSLDLEALDDVDAEPLSLEELDTSVPDTIEGADDEVEIIDLSEGEELSELELIDDLELVDDLEPIGDAGAHPPAARAEGPVREAGDAAVSFDDLFAIPASPVPEAPASAADLDLAFPGPERVEIELEPAAEPPPIVLPASEPLTDGDFLEPAPGEPLPIAEEEWALDLAGQPAAAGSAWDVPAEEPLAAEAPVGDFEFGEAVAPLAAAAAPAVAAALPPQLDIESLTPLIERVVERVAWEVVPQLAERLIREAIEKLQTDPPSA